MKRDSRDSTPCRRSWLARSLPKCWFTGTGQKETSLGDLIGFEPRVRGAYAKRGTNGVVFCSLHQEEAQEQLKETLALKDCEALLVQRSGECLARQLLACILMFPVFPRIGLFAL